MGQVSGVPASGSFCGHAHGFLTISYLILIVGAILIGIGAMILPTLRARDARMAREQAAIAAALAAAAAGAAKAGAEKAATADATTTPPGSPEADSEAQSESGSPQSESANPS
jgi:type II secretory pathway pseudopilin PulG